MFFILFLYVARF